MENFDSKNYRDNLAEDLKDIRKTDPETAQQVLKYEKGGIRYQEAEGVAKEKRKAIQDGIGDLFEFFKGKYTKDQIALSPEEINENTKIYNGPFVKDIFKKLPLSIERVYENFPDGEVKFKEIVVGNGPKTGEEFKTAIRAAGREVQGDAAEIMKYITYSPDSKKLHLVILTEKQLGKGDDYYHGNGWNMDARALELGLKLVPAEVGPELALQYTDQPYEDRLFINSEPVHIPDEVASRANYNEVLRVISRGNDKIVLGHPKQTTGYGDKYVFARDIENEIENKNIN